MKKYIKPEINVELLEIEDIITTSVGGELFGRYLIETVNGNDAQPYGSQNVSVLE